MRSSSGSIVFSASAMRVQEERGSRAAYARVEQNGGFDAVITDELRAFLAGVDTAFLASASADGQPYVQHRGGPKGFVHALDEGTLAFADFTGNRQYVTTGNLLENDRVCLLLIDYARRRRVKIWGTARVAPATDALIEVLGTKEYPARVEQVILLTVSAIDVNCPQHIPQKLDAVEVAKAVAQLKSRIVELEAENRELRHQSR